VFPVSLCERVIMYYSFKGDLVFDPFAGRGTFGKAATNLDRYFFLTEKEPKYFKYMKTFLTSKNIFKQDKTRFVTLNEYKNIVNK